MDTRSPRENEQILHAFIEQEHPHVAGLVGIEALTILAREMPSEKFKEFLQQAIHDAGRLKQAVAQPAAAGAGESGKLSKAEVHYEHPAKGADHCGACRHFDGQNGCEIVAGPIEPGDWCERFEAKTGEQSTAAA